MRGDVLGLGRCVEDVAKIKEIPAVSGVQTTAFTA